jgi:hypothetical protein
LLQEVEAMETAGRRAREAFAALPKAPARFLDWPELAADVRARKGRGASKPAPEQSVAWRQGIGRATALPRVPPSYAAFLRWFPRPTEWKLVESCCSWVGTTKASDRARATSRPRSPFRELDSKTGRRARRDDSPL